MIVPEVRPAHVPMKVFGLQIKRERVRPEPIQGSADVFSSLRFQIGGRVQWRRLLMLQIRGFGCLRCFHDLSPLMYFDANSLERYNLSFVRWRGRPSSSWFISTRDPCSVFDGSVPLARPEGGNFPATLPPAIASGYNLRGGIMPPCVS